MKTCFKTLPLSLLLTVGLPANPSTVTPPAQATSGPGGSTYQYSLVTEYGPYYVNPENKKVYTSYYIFEPAGSSTPASLPVVLFLHGFLAGLEGYTVGDSPSNYLYWIDHIVRNGYTVVFPTYDDTLTAPEFQESILNAWQSALTRLQSGNAGMVRPKTDSLGMQTVFTGHSMGAFESFAVAQSLTTNPLAGVPIPRAIAAFNPGLGNSGTLSIALSAISPSISVVLTDADQDSVDIPTAQEIWGSIGTAIPAANRDFLEVITDSHGTPAQIGNHWFPDTNGLEDNDSGLDDRDFNITWKLSVGLFDCVLAGTNCSYGLGHGSVNQISMGNWSDGTPVNTLLLQNSY